MSNVSAGLTVALVALPLNLALAIACGLPPSVGLVTGAIAGIVGGFLGASRFQITGPEVALAPITLEIVIRHGLEGLIAATFLAGLMQIAFGLFRVGRLVKAIPVPVIGGFLAAVGLLVFDSQLPRLLNLPGEVSHVSQMRDVRVLGQIDPAGLLLGVMVVAVVVLAPRLARRIPAPLAALAVAVGAALVFDLRIPAVEPIEGVFPAPAFPAFGQVDLVALLPEAIALAVLASIDSLLCAVSVDGLMGGERTRSDQELVAQGMANLASACFGGMPVAAAVVRSMAAIQAGASTRTAPIVQSLLLALVLVALAPLVSYVPLVALAGILLVVGYRLINWRQLIDLWRMARFEAAVFLVTAAGILVTDFVMGVMIGVVAALAHFARQQRSLVSPEPPAGSVEPPRSVELSLPAQEVLEAAGARVVRLTGPLFFGSQDRVEEMLRKEGAARHVVVDLSGVSTIDMSGAQALANALKQVAVGGVGVHVSGLAPHGDELVRWLLSQLEPAGVKVIDPLPHDPSLPHPTPAQELAEELGLAAVSGSEGAPPVGQVVGADQADDGWPEPYEPANGVLRSRAAHSTQQEMNHGPSS